MCRRRHLLPGLLLCLAAGCATEQSARTADGPGRALPPPIGPESVIIQVAWLERPVGDNYLNKGVWSSTDEHAVAIEKEMVLEDNGFRVGRLVGATPRDLQKMLTNDRYCVRRWQQVISAGKSLTVKIGEPVPGVRYRVGQEPEAVLDKAVPCLVIVPTLTADGRTRLQFTPQVQFGDIVPEIKVAPDRSGLVWAYQRPNKTYPTLSWEIALAPNEYFIIGATLDNQESLGYQSFVRASNQSVGQRLLVIRTSRSTVSLEDVAPEWQESLASANLAPPLALQANWTSTRQSRGE